MNEVILNAVEILKKTFGGIDIQILDTEMSRKYPDNYAKLGYLGITISVDNDVRKHKVFLKYQTAEDIVTLGFHIAESFIYDILKDDFSLMLLKIKQQERKEKLEKINNTNEINIKTN